MKTSTFKISNKADGTVLRGRYWHADKPRAVLNLIHGLGEHCGRYAPMAQYLAGHGITTAAIDLRGHGQSDGKRGVTKTITPLYGDISALLEMSAGKYPDLPHILMGHSMGGGLVLGYCEKTNRPNLAGVVAQAPLIGFVQSLPAPVILVMKALRKIAPSMAIKSQIKGEKVSSLPEEQSQYENDPLNHGFLGIGLGLDLIKQCAALQERKGDFPYPLLVTHGDQDVLTDFEASRNFAHATPNATFIPYAQARHEVHNEFCRDQVHADLLGWIDAQIGPKLVKSGALKTAKPKSVS